MKVVAYKIQEICDLTVKKLSKYVDLLLIYGFSKLVCQDRLILRLLESLIPQGMLKEEKILFSKDVFFSDLFKRFPFH